MSDSTTSLWYRMSLRAVMASRSGALIRVGPNTMPKFSLDMRFSFSLLITLDVHRENERGELVVRCCRLLDGIKCAHESCIFTSSDEPWGIAVSHSELEAAASRPRGETPDVFLHLWSLHGPKKKMNTDKSTFCCNVSQLKHRVNDHR